MITAFEASTLLDALKIVTEALGNTNHAKEEVEKIMGGKILTFSADKYFYAGKEEGIAEGKTEGFNEDKTEGFIEGKTEGFNEGNKRGTVRTLWELVLDHLINLDVAASRANLSVEEFIKEGSALMGEPVQKYIANM